MLCGGGLVLAYPPYDNGWLAWVSFVPLLLYVHAQRDAGVRPTLLAGIVAGLVYFGGVMVWSLNILFSFVRDATLSSVLVYLMLSGYLGTLYVGGFALLARRLFRRWGALGWLGVPVLWAALELMRTHFFIPFPWGLLGPTQYRWLAVLQSASVWGVYGLGFLVVAVNAALAAMLSRQRATRTVRGFVAGTAALLTICWLGGWLALRGDPPRGTALTVGVVQPSVAQDQRWNPERALEILSRYGRASETLVQGGAELVFWPETATPLLLTDPRVLPGMREFVARHDVELIAGSLRKTRSADGVERIHNSTYLFRRDGSIGEIYDKVLLTPFGEYVPYRRVWPFMPQLAGAMGEMAPVAEPVLLETAAGPAGVLTCYEGLFPHLASGVTRKGAAFLFNPSNEAWHKQGRGRVQLMAGTLVRAVEQRRYLLRAVNTGISAVIDPYGRIVARAAENEDAVLLETIHARDDRTIYDRAGWLFPWVCAALGVAALLGRRRGDAA